MALHETRASTDINHIVRVWRNANYPKQVIYFVVSFIFIVSLWNAISIIRNYLLVRNAKSHGRAIDSEAQAGAGATGRASIRRVPLAIVSCFRVLALRKTIPYGFERHITLAEVLIPLMYLMAIITWDFVNCTWDVLNTFQNICLLRIGNDVGTKNFDIAFLANRSGTIAASQLTFIVALAGKNNIISCTSI